MPQPKLKLAGDFSIKASATFFTLAVICTKKGPACKTSCGLRLTWCSPASLKRFKGNRKWRETDGTEYFKVPL